MILSFALLCGVSSYAVADTIHLKNGQVLVGTVVYQDSEIVRIRTGAHAVRVSKANVRRIQYAEQDSEEYKRAQARDERIRKERARDREARIRAERKRLEQTSTRMSVQWLDAAWRAFLLPGWGHFHVGKVQEAGIVGSVALGGILAAAYAREQALRARSSYQNRVARSALALPLILDGSEPFALHLATSQRQFNAYRHRVSRANGIWIAIGVLHLGQVLHAIGSAPDKSAGGAWLDFEVAGAAGGEAMAGLSVSLAW